MRGGKLLSNAFIAFMLLAVLMQPAVAALNYSDGSAPNPYVDEDSLTKAKHDMSEMSSFEEYENDQGELVTLDAVVNDSADNPYTLTATNINATDFSEFPRKSEEDNAASALDASEYTKSGANSSKLTVADIETAPGVPAVRYNTDGTMASGDTATAVYSNFSITSDENKRYLQLAADVNTLDSGTTVTAKLVDEDGDYKEVDVANSSATASADDVLANSTGDGQVLQIQVGTLDTLGSGDGTFNNVESIEFVVSDGDFDGSFALINAEKMGTYKFGTEKVDTDDDDALEEEDIETPRGAFSVYALSTLGATFDSAVIHDLSAPVKFRAQDLDDADIKTEFNDTTSYPGFDVVASVYYRIQVPSAYDLSHSGLSLEQTTEWPGERYTQVEYKEGVGDTDFADISNWNDVTGSFDSQDKDITIDSTIQADQEIALHYDIKLTQSEADAMQASGLTGGPMGQSDGGILDSILSLPGMIITAILGFLGLKSRGG